MKLAVIGAGSTYTPELAFELAGNDAPEITTLALHDIDAERLGVVGGFVERILRHHDSPVAVERTTDLDEALREAAFVITQVRVGGQSARYLDETIPLKFDCIGQETTGAGGFAMALRAVPVMTEIAERMQVVAPDAWLVNFANPAGLVAEAIMRTGARAVGLCNLPLTYERGLAGAFGDGTVLDYFGLNHLSWVRSVVDPNGDDRLPEVLASFPEQGEFPRSLVETLGLLPCYYLRYYYMTSAALAEQKASQTRAEEVMEIERATLAKYADHALVERPPELSQRGGAWYNTAAVNFVRAVTRDTGQRQVLNVANRGTIPGLPDDATVEVPCAVSSAGAVPLDVASPPEHARGLMETVKAYERLTIDAALTGSRRTALQALLAHPLVRDHDIAAPLLDELLAAHAPYLPRFAAAG
ncbi:MAG: 6-phospho-beta-glucosidase [Actinomycetes bacterium]